MPAANRPDRNLSRHSQNLLLPLNTEMGIATSADLEPYPQSAHISGLLLPLICTSFGPNPHPDITGSQTPTDPQRRGQSRRGMSWKLPCSRNREHLWDQIFLLQTHVGFVPGSIQCAHRFLLQVGTSHFTPLWFWFLYHLLILVSKECNQCSLGAVLVCTKVNQLQHNHLGEFFLYVYFTLVLFAYVI